MTAFHLQSFCLAVITLLAPSMALGETLGPVRKQRRQVRKVHVEKRHDPTALDRRLLPSPQFGALAAPVGGLVVTDAHWDPFNPAAAKLYTITGGRGEGLRRGDRLLVWRGKNQVVVAEVEVVELGEETAQVKMVRQPDPTKVLPLDLRTVMAGDRVSMLMRARDDVWPKAKRKRRPRRRIIAKKGQPDTLRKAAEPAQLPAGKDTIVINGRELPKQAANEVRLTPAQLPEVQGQAKGSAKKDN
jgi:hypothetical protein